MALTLHGRLSDDAQTKSRAAGIENKSALYETKLEEELADRGVYHHMIQRLTREALDAKKETLAREAQLKTLQQELSSSMAALLAARQEKSAAENLYKHVYQDWWEAKQQNVRALDDLTQAVEQTKLKFDILEQREVSRKKHVAEALGELKQQASRRLRYESSAQMTHFSELQEELSDTDWKLLAVESELKKIVEAAGTSDVDKIIAKYVGRDETLRALKDEHTVADARMRKLREQHKQLHERLSALRGAAVNSRTIYQEMDQTSERLKDIEKEAAALADRFNRSNVMMDAFRACLLKCLAKLGAVHGSLDFDDHHEQGRAAETPTADLLHMVEQKLNRVLDVINREKAERELHRSEANAAAAGGTNPAGAADGADKAAFARAPAPAETEEHFILRMSTANTSPANIRVRPKSRTSAARPPPSGRRQGSTNHLSKRPTASGVDGGVAAAGGDGGEQRGDDGEVGVETTAVAGTGTGAASEVTEEMMVIDRHMRKKLVGLVVNRTKRGKKPAMPAAP